VQQAHVEWPVWQVQLVNFGAHGPDTALLLLAIAPLWLVAAPCLGAL